MPRKSEQMKQRWGNCEHIARMITVTENFVITKEWVYKCWRDLVAEGFIVKDEYNPKPGFKEFFDKWNRSLSEVPERKSPAKDLNLAFWYIDKIGDRLRAKVLLELALEALEKLDANHSTHRNGQVAGVGGTLLSPPFNA